MLKSSVASSYSFKGLSRSKNTRHSRLASALKAQIFSASSKVIQMRYEEIRKARGFRGWTEEEYGERVLELVTLVPVILEPAQRFPAALLLALLSDTDGIASRLISLKQLFPAADVFRIVSKRPRLLLEEEFSGAEIAAVKLRQLFPETDVSVLAEKAPLLLVEDVDDIVADLRRLFPQPDLLGQNIISAPHIVLSAQRGSKSLGPAAEY